MASASLKNIILLLLGAIIVIAAMAIVRCDVTELQTQQKQRAIREAASTPDLTP